MQGFQDIYIAKYSLAIFIVSLVFILEKKISLQRKCSSKKLKVYKDLDYFIQKYPISFLICTELVYYWIYELMKIYN